MAQAGSQEFARLLWVVADALRAQIDSDRMRDGPPVVESRSISTDGVGYFDYYAGMVDKIEGGTIRYRGID